MFYHIYNQPLYQAPDEINPLTFTMGNTMKRVVVIVAIVLVFKNPIKPLNALCSMIVILGPSYTPKLQRSPKQDLVDVQKA
jgi:solute carrier family 35 protein E1